MLEHFFRHLVLVEITLKMLIICKKKSISKKKSEGMEGERGKRYAV